MNGIAHRDVSLENVLLRDGVCKIPDFGFATYVGYLCTEVVGKSYCMTPEVAAGESEQLAETMSSRLFANWKCTAWFKPGR
ncbi:hypothetical protein BBJ29_010085 [Phytophthora kernoviae]|uniref:Protein kinase domain-containing protein n=1 Tax=Phytophthora kernoviae TaxID=325452 RepID=A0A3F2RAT9_9STRA|nr:hypothetical protein BBJ29_010085 [Phytophthora kernoviae]RLN50059.1 hypothetical protein BBP00_00010081 [Phytophthora kernoviae]